VKAIVYAAVGDQVFPAPPAVDAFDRLQAPGKLGKILLDFDS